MIDHRAHPCRRRDGAADRVEEPRTVGILNQYVPYEGDAGTYTQDQLAHYYERLLSIKDHFKGKVPETPASLLDVDPAKIPPALHEAVGAFNMEMTALLGERTAQLHGALSSEKEDPDFTPESFSKLYQRSVYQSMRGQARRYLDLLSRTTRNLPREVRKDARFALRAEKDIMKCFAQLLQKKFSAAKIRIHGDYHLGQVLFTGKDFVIIDFEGEPAKPISERRLKRSPFRDVAGMIRSFHYAAYTALFLRRSVRKRDWEFLEPWAELWYYYVSGTFLKAYLKTSENFSFAPKNIDDFEILLETFLLDKAVYELGYELNSRPEWVDIPLRGIKHILTK